MKDKALAKQVVTDLIISFALLLRLLYKSLIII